MNEYWAFLLVFFGALAICLGGSYYMDGRLRKRLEERIRNRLIEARNASVLEGRMGWGDGIDTEDDCEDCGDDDE